VRLDPNDPEAFDNRGNVFNNNNQYDRAIEDYNEAIRLDPKDSLAFMDRGVAHYFKEEYQEAIRDYDDAIRLDPKRSPGSTARSTTPTRPRWPSSTARALPGCARASAISSPRATGPSAVPIISSSVRWSGGWWRCAE
jgi:tetratricopeptide (TPR) repeat protein